MRAALKTETVTRNQQTGLKADPLTTEATKPPSHFVGPGFAPPGPLRVPVTALLRAVVMALPIPPLVAGAVCADAKIGIKRESATLAKRNIPMSASRVVLSVCMCIINIIVDRSPPLRPVRFASLIRHSVRIASGQPAESATVSVQLESAVVYEVRVRSVSR